MPTAYPTVRILVAGAGAFGREHLGRLAARSDVEVVGVADPDPAALASVTSSDRPHVRNGSVDGIMMMWY